MLSGTVQRLTDSMAKNLTLRQATAATHWVDCDPKYRSYAASYRYAYDAQNMSNSVVHKEAGKLFKLPHIVRFVAERMYDISKEAARLKAAGKKKTTFDQAYILHKASLLAEFNLKNFIKIESDTSRPYYDFSKATDDDWWCLDEITIDQVVSGPEGHRLYVDKVRIKTTKRRDALKLIGDHVKVAAFAHPGARGPAAGSEAAETRTLQPAERVSRIEHLLKLAEQRETEAKAGA